MRVCHNRRQRMRGLHPPLQRLQTAAIQLLFLLAVAAVSTLAHSPQGEQPGAPSEGLQEALVTWCRAAAETSLAASAPNAAVEEELRSVLTAHGAQAAPVRPSTASATVRGESDAFPPRGVTNRRPHAPPLTHPALAAALQHRFNYAMYTPHTMHALSMARRRRTVGGENATVPATTPDATTAAPTTTPSPFVSNETLHYLRRDCVIAACKWELPEHEFKQIDIVDVQLTCCLASVDLVKTKIPTDCHLPLDSVAVKVLLDNCGDTNDGGPSAHAFNMKAASVLGHLLAQLPVPELAIENGAGSALEAVVNNIAFPVAPQLDTFIMRYTSLSAMPTQVLVAAKNISTLVLAYNRITSLSRLGDAAAAYTNLKTLILWSNDITDVARGALDGCSQLELVDLGHNQLSTLPEDLFAAGTSLKLLALDYNALSALPTDLLKGHRSIRAFTVAKNRLTALHVDFLRDQVQLTTFVASNNAIRELDAALFSNAILETVDLEYNDLSSINGALFAHLQGHARLSISFASNKLAHVDLNHMPELKLLSLAENWLSTLHVPASVTLLNVSYSSNLRELTLAAPIEALDISATAIPFTNIDCTVAGWRHLLMREMRDPSWDAATVTRQCLNTEHREILDISGLSGLAHVNRMQAATSNLYAFSPGDAEALSGSYFAEVVPDKAHISQVHLYAIRLLPRLLVSGDVLQCSVKVGGATAYSVHSMEYVPVTGVFSAYYDCRCIQGYQAKDGYCHQDLPWIAEPRNLAAVIMTTLLGAALVAAIVLFVRRRAHQLRGMRADLQLHQHLLADAEHEVIELKAAWHIEAADVRLLDRIDLSSPGAYGEVWRGDWDGVPVAVKVLREGMMALDSASVEEVKREADFMMRARHANVVRFFGVGEMEGGAPFLVLELAALGSLRALLDTASTDVDDIPRQLRQEHIQLRIAADVARGMAYIHSLGHLHRDLKSGNILITDAWHAKVADFGSISGILLRNAARRRQDTTFRATVSGSKAESSGASVAPRGAMNVHLTAGIGTLLYMSPEALRGDVYDGASDVWSFAVCIYELVSGQSPDLLSKNGREPGRGPAGGHLLALLTAGKRLELGEHAPHWAEAICTQCFRSQASERPDFVSLVARLEAESSSE